MPGAVNSSPAASVLVDEVVAVVEAEHVQEDLLEGRGAGAVTQGTDHGGQGVSDLQGLEQLEIGRAHV